MKDLETLKDMLTRAQIKFVELPAHKENHERPATETEITVTAGDSDQNLGYYEFFSVFGFDKDGALIWIGAWE